MSQLLPPNYWAYIAMTVLVCLTPGPAVLFVVGQASWRGARAGIAAALGISVGNLIYFVLTAFGLAAMIAASDVAFTLIKYAGAAYLFWLGASALYGSFRANAAPAASGRQSVRSFRDGIVVQLANPKAILFFLALLPQFIDPTRSVPGQTFFLALAGCAIEIIVLSGYALIGGALTAGLAAPDARRWFDRGVGAIFLALAVAALLMPVHPA